MNKKLVIAALLAAAAAQNENVEENAEENQAEENVEQPEQPAENNEQAEEKPEENVETPEKVEEGDASDGEKDPDVRDAWKEVIGQDQDGKDIERVLCAGWGDEGEAALWDEAQEKFKDLQGKAAKAKEAVDAAQQNYDDLKKAYDDRKKAADDHAEVGKQYLDAWTEADEQVKALVKAQGGADETTAKAASLKEFTDLTAAAEAAVDTQRGRVEKILLAKRTQDGEVALWGERVNAANTAVQTATTVKEAADDAVAEAKAQVSTRSWLFEMLNGINSTSYADACNSPSKPCAIVETTSVAQGDPNLSTWDWPANGCDYTTGENENVVNHSCTMLGISGPNNGLVGANTAAKGVARDGNTAPTELYNALETADYTYVSAATPLNNADSSKLAIALDGYETW